MGIFLSWVALSFVVGFIGQNRKIGFAGAFFLSLFLSPLVGLIVTVISKSDEQAAYEQKMLDLQQKQVEQGTRPTEYIGDRLQKLKRLLDEGILTNEEYEEQRKRILGEA